MAGKRAFRGLHPSVRAEAVALVLSGGGALGAYEVGVLRVLERVGLAPRVLAGSSVGALNGLSWLALGRRTKPLMRLWRTLNPSGIGLRWTTLTLRLVGFFLVVLAGAEIVLALAGQQNLSAWVSGRLRPPSAVLPDVLDLWVWVLLGVLGWAIARGTRVADRLLARWPRIRRPEILVAVLGWTVGILVALWAAAWLWGWAWPMRAHALLTLVLAGTWLALALQGRVGSALNEALRRVLRDTHGAGLWGSSARRAVLERMIQLGDAERLAPHEARIILSACGLHSGRITYFLNWKADEREFLRSVGQPTDRVVTLQSLQEMVRAALASSALPIIFEPVKLRGERYVDAAMFANQPLRAAIAAGAERALVVLLSPEKPRPHDRLSNLLSVGARLLEIGQMRDAQNEISNLPAGWTAAERPLRLCVVRPARALEGGVLGFDPGRHRRLMERGREDAWSALEAAGWLARPPEREGAA